MLALLLAVIWRLTSRWLLRVTARLWRYLMLLTLGSVRWRLRAYLPRLAITTVIIRRWARLVRAIILPWLGLSWLR